MLMSDSETIQFKTVQSVSVLVVQLYFFHVPSVDAPQSTTVAFNGTTSFASSSSIAATTPLTILP